MNVDFIFCISESVSNLSEPVDEDKVTVTFHPGSRQF